MSINVLQRSGRLVLKQAIARYVFGCCRGARLVRWPRSGRDYRQLVVQHPFLSPPLTRFRSRNGSLRPSEVAALAAAGFPERLVQRQQRSARLSLKNAGKCGFQESTRTINRRD